LQRIKERHRLLAKYIAAGLTRNEIAARLDYTPERVGQLSLDPAMQNLVAQFRNHDHVREMAGFDEIALLRSVSVQNALRSAMAMQDTLNYYEDADERMPVRESAKIFELSADRVGFGKHATNINVNVDFAAQLDQAIDRSRSAKLVSGKLSSPDPSREGGAGAATHTPPPAPQLSAPQEGEEPRGEVLPRPAVRARSVQEDRPASLLVPRRF
jgi:hypothetical protein